jgi:hypothetical protein
VLELARRPCVSATAETGWRKRAASMRTWIVDGKDGLGENAVANGDQSLTGVAFSEARPSLT